MINNKYKLIGFLIGILPFLLLLIVLNILNSNMNIFKLILIISMIITGISNSFILDYKINKMD